MFIDSQCLYVVPEGIETRWASPENPGAIKGKGGQAGGGRKSAACFSLKSGESRVLAEEKGISGTIRRIWVTISNRDAVMLRGIRLDFYWDGQEKPAISAPLGDFFGVGLGRMSTFQSAFFTSPEGRSFNCYIPMPFKHGMKIMATNLTDIKLDLFFYDIDYTVGDKHGSDVLYLHAYYHRENPTIIQKDFEILPRVSGRGRYLGCNIGVTVDTRHYYKCWWGEGEVKVYIDGDTDYPSLCGTGTEDFIGTGWGQGRYDHLYQGCHVADEVKMQYCFYRYHVPDPIYFGQDIRVTIQQIGWMSENDKASFYYNGDVVYSTEMKMINFAKGSGTNTSLLFERCDDWSACAYYYLDSSINCLLG